MISVKQNFCCSDHPSDPTKKKKGYAKSQTITTPNSVGIICWGVGIGNTLSNNIRYI